MLLDKVISLQRNSEKSREDILDLVDEVRENIGSSTAFINLFVQELDNDTILNSLEWIARQSNI